MGIRNGTHNRPGLPWSRRVSMNGTLASEKTILLEFRNSVFDPSGVLSSWKSSENPNHCTWFGVSCNSRSRVIFIDISGGCGELWGLENLEELDLEGNSFTGELPDEIVGLRNLRVLNLGLNELEGEVPASLSKFVDLEVLNLAGNKLKGSMSGYFGGFYKLKGLYLSNNQLNGPILENLDIIVGI
ncbi:LRR receptor-like serine/threonine-protein kinase RPK2 [Hibiscus syriacus]|uniref:LRR receptor-like serine/threonine-protein kinase RPK2 n=1 Tax=Hibiscus syriacus TaxID=106335 RepID=UPI001921766B|nr:LRR receptor-like serine/threonine-protein kinase RPK2 [Hibiscus syriacus]